MTPRQTQLGSCASSGRAWRLWLARPSREEAGPLGAQPLPRVLERAASKAADSTAFDLPGVVVARKGVIARVEVKHAHDPNEPLVSGGHALLEGLTPDERRSLLDQAPPRAVVRVS